MNELAHDVLLKGQSVMETARADARGPRPRIIGLMVIVVSSFPRDDRNISGSWTGLLVYYREI
jgi:hypothetical protein